MVSRVLICSFFLFVSVNPVFSGHRQLCLSCHSTHYVERGQCTFCHLGNSATERKNIAHGGMRSGKYIRFTLGDVTYNNGGERLMDTRACRRCHVSGGRGNPLAVSLDDSAGQKTSGDLSHSIRHPVAAMPDFAPDDEQVIRLVNVIFAGSQGRTTGEAAPMRVHFNSTRTKNADIFTAKCGSCHKILSQRRGALGSGETAPNLSGLLSDFYPKTFRNGEAWTVRELTGWLKNPREIKPWAKMQPVTLTAAELKELVSIIFVSPEVN